MVYMISLIAFSYNKSAATKDALSIFKITYLQLIPVLTGDLLLRCLLPDLTHIWTMAFSIVFMAVVGKESENYYKNLKI